MAYEPPLTSNDCLRRMREGDTEALASLLQQYRPRLRNMLDRHIDQRLAARIDASEVIQEAYVDAAARIQDYLRDPRVEFYVWLRGLARERLLRLHRKHVGAKCRSVKREQGVTAGSTAALARQLVASQSSPSRAVVRRELEQRVQGALGELDPAAREVLLMRHYEQMSNHEIAQTLGLSDSAASMRYGRALSRFKSLLEDQHAAGGLSL